jgi:CRISPR-associated protein Csm1
MEKNDQVFLAALAGLLHDIGKFALRAGEGEGGEVINLLSFHLSNLQSREKIKGWVDSAVGWIENGKTLGASSNSDDALTSILGGISISEEVLNNERPAAFCRIAPLNPLDRQTMFPTSHRPAQSEVKGLWEAFQSDLSRWQEQLGKNWHNQPIRSYLFTLTSLLYKYLWCLPAEIYPPQQGKASTTDASLYDHARLISGLAACLAYDQLQSESAADKAVLLVRGDFSGIQDFIYRISRPEATTENIAKRLRGRSFYLQALSEVIVDWIMRRFDLPNTCVVFVGGGRFDLILPVSAVEEVEKLRLELDEWMLNRFGSELSILIAAQRAEPDDLADTGRVNARLNEELENQKLTKWRSLFNQPGFFQPFGNVWHRCPVCSLTPVQNENQICKDCNQHLELGKHLPYTAWLAYCYAKPKWENEKTLDFSQPFGVWVCLIRNEDSIQQFIRDNPDSLLWAVNRTDQYIQPYVGSSFRFLANQAPRAIQPLTSGDLSIQAGDVLTFEAMAELGQGDDRLGVLVADVDQLGLVMSEGLRRDGQSPSILRTAALSRMLDLFFSGYLNTICSFVSPQNSQRAASGLFYILYAGGDDLFIVGPWYEVLLLAKQINEEFHAYCAENPQMSISAGYVQVKPRYPVQKFAELAKQAEQRAKNDGRNRLHLFNQSVVWKGDEGLDWLLEQVEEWLKAINGKEMNRGMIYDLGQLYRSHLTAKGELKPIWTPRLYYTLVRRLTKEALSRYQNRLLRVIASGKVLVPVSITSLLIRERRK